MTPKSNNGGPHEKPTTTKSPGHAGVLQTKGNMPTQKPPTCTVCQRQGTKNPGPLTPPHGHGNLKVEPQTKTTATWTAQSERQNRLTPPTSSLGLTPRSEASAKHEEHQICLNLQQPRAPPAPRRAASQHSEAERRGNPCREESMTPKSKHGGPHETHNDHAGVQIKGNMPTQKPRPALVLPGRLLWPRTSARPP